MIGKQYDDDQTRSPRARFFVREAMAWRSIGHGVDLFTPPKSLHV